MYGINKEKQQTDKWIGDPRYTQNVRLCSYHLVVVVCVYARFGAVFVYLMLKTELIS